MDTRSRRASIRVVSESGRRAIDVLDQRRLPWRVELKRLATSEDVRLAICEMVVRGAPLIGVTAAFGAAFAVDETADETGAVGKLEQRLEQLTSARPTAVNLSWAVSRVLEHIRPLARASWSTAAHAEAVRILEEDVEACRRIGEHGLALFQSIAERKRGGVVNVLTHCNAGWLACVEHGTATSPIYQAFDAGVPLHVWVDETRPRNQGARLTAWELAQHGIPHTVVVDNAGGHLMARGLVDLCVVGSDRVASNGDVANKIGTYLKALAAQDTGVPFYVAFPLSTVDWALADGSAIVIEERDGGEVREMEGLIDGEANVAQVVPASCAVSNFGFDVTPARLVTQFITERGLCHASAAGLRHLRGSESA